MHDGSVTHVTVTEEKNIEDFEIGDVIQHSNNMLAL